MPINKSMNYTGIVKIKYFTFASKNNPFKLECGKTLNQVTLAYEIYGNAKNIDKTILIQHALSGDAHAGGRYSPEDKKPGWWDAMIGPGKTFDTDKYYIICINVIGGCQGSTGPGSINPDTGNPYGSSFPLLTIRDMVNAQVELINHLGVDKILTVVGGSMGGMLTLRWAADYPDRVISAIPIATASKHSAMPIAFYEVGRQAIITDPNWNGGNYYEKETPAMGLAIARMIAHITYLSDESMHNKFARRLQDSSKNYQFSFETEFQIESYLHYQGTAFVSRFDANSYLIITKAMDYFDLSYGYKNLAETFSEVKSKFLVVSFSSDWHYPPKESKEIVTALRMNDVDVTYSEINSSHGHDAFLIEFKKLGSLLSGFLNNLEKEISDV